MLRISVEINLIQKVAQPKHGIASLLAGGGMGVSMAIDVASATW
jgi:hypothetical protein